MRTVKPNESYRWETPEETKARGAVAPMMVKLPERNWIPLSEEEQKARMPVSSWQTWGEGED